ncbi:MAG: beta-N-acetylhexosaminidase [Acidobacteriota bacterium]
MARSILVSLVILAAAAVAPAETVTPLWARGYAVIPAPHTVRLASGDVALDGRWVVDAGALPAKNISVKTLVDGVSEWHGLALARGTAATRVIRLAVTPGAVKTGADPGIDKQGYRLRAAAGKIEISGNSEQGLFYGVQTLLQLIRRTETGALAVPAGEIEDWPKLELRFLHWDTKHHQDRMETLKRFIDWSAKFKINMIGFELEDKFEYPSHPVIGAPGAFTTAQLQEIVNYGLERFIQVVPQVQAPAHMSYVLKHPEFAHLRADGNNYQSALCDPRTYDLIFSMYDDVINATRGVDYFFASTDEVYYAGIEGTCRPYNIENRSLTWVEFVRRAQEHLAKRGRKMLLWVEYPLLAKHVNMLPGGIIDGIIGDADYLPAENALGIRQLAYVSMQGEERLFPNNLRLSQDARPEQARVEAARDSILHGKHWKGNPIGAFGAAWSDAGLHNETFWLGWSALAQWAWNPEGAMPDEHVAQFMQVFYGPEAQGMVDIYAMMQRQARAWEHTWDRVISKVRGPGYGNSRGKGVGVERFDYTLTAPALPALPDLKVAPVIESKYGEFLREARERAAENERLALAIQTNMGRPVRNRYSLEVMLALTRLTGQHWRLLDGMARAEQALVRAQEAAGKDDAARAVAELVQARDIAANLGREREKNFADLTSTFEKSHYPNGREVGGRKFVLILDDVKDHFGGRTADLSYMVVPERSIGLDAWGEAVLKVADSYAKAHNLRLRRFTDVAPEE